MTVARKPAWLQKRWQPEKQLGILNLLRKYNLTTVCQQALCPNISECFGRSQATFLILGSRCTRRCSFCNLEKKPPLPVDAGEAERVALAVHRLHLSHVVITSPTRDDLDDGGAGFYAETVAAIRTLSPSTSIELLIPDLQGDHDNLATVTACRPDTIGHNMETVPRLYHFRDGADYLRSLGVLRVCRQNLPAVRIKSGIMVGMGETTDEVIQVFNDLHDAGCDILTIGQYLAPGRHHVQVHEYVPLSTFAELKKAAEGIGIRHVESGPYVRSSYRAGEYT